MAVRKRKIAKAVPVRTARGRIQVLKLIRQLEDHALGKLELRPTQVSAALGLLKKVLPDVGKAAVKPEGRAARQVVVAWAGK